MEIRIAETAGFCYGVRRAIEIAEREAGQGTCYALGSLIHNSRELERLEKLGLRTLRSPEEAPEGGTVVIRSHGEPDSTYETLRRKGCRIVDATCPNVTRIHKIVRQAAENGRVPIVIGDRDHPEVQGIAGSAGGVVVLKNEQEVRRWLENASIPADTPITIVYQTTEIRERVKFCSEILKKVFSNAETFDTICEATYNRQKEAVRLSAICDAMLVVGDRNSANTRRLAEVCAGSSVTVIFAETASERNLSDLKDVRTLGVTAGASTPAWIIKEVCAKMTEEIKETIETEEKAAESFDELLAESFKTLNNGDKV